MVSDRFHRDDEGGFLIVKKCLSTLWIYCGYVNKS